MKLVLFMGNIFVPFLMVVLQKKWSNLALYYHLVALLSGIVFGAISAFAIYDILRDETVFMTNIHAIFLNPLFLLTGAYLGIYFLYGLIVRIRTTQ